MPTGICRASHWASVSRNPGSDRYRSGTVRYPPPPAPGLSNRNPHGPQAQSIRRLGDVHQMRVLGRHRLRRTAHRPPAPVPGRRARPGTGAGRRAQVTAKRPSPGPSRRGGLRSAAGPAPRGRRRTTTPASSGASSSIAEVDHVLDRVRAAAAARDEDVHPALGVELAEADARAVRAQLAPAPCPARAGAGRRPAPGAGRAGRAGPRPAGRPPSGKPSCHRPRPGRSRRSARGPTP